MYRTQFDILLNNIRLVLIALVFFSLPFSPALNSILIILLALIGFYFFVISKFKLSSFSTIQVLFLMFFSLTILHCVKDWFIFEQFSPINKYLVLLAGPFCFYRLRITQKYLDQLLQLFTGLIFIICLIDVIHFIFVPTSYYLSFDIIAGLHPTYLSLYILVTLAYVLNKNHFERSVNGVVVLVVILIFISSIMLLVARSAIIAMVLLVIYSFFVNRKAVKLTSIILFFFATISIFLFFNSNEFYDRIMSTIDLFLSGEKFSSSGLLLRANIWLTLTKEILINNFILGFGLSQSTNFFLIYSYLENDVFLAYRDNYNAHNQFLQLILNFGFLSLVIVFKIFKEIIYGSIKIKQYHFIMVAIIFISLFFTEVVLARQKGIVFFIFLSLLFESRFKLDKKIEWHIQ